MFKFIISISLILSSCGSFHHRKEKDTKSSLELFNVKYQTYLYLTQQRVSATGYVHQKGDSLFHTSLFVIAGGRADLNQFLKCDGTPYRTPNFNDYQNYLEGQGGSKSDCSYDGQLMYAMARYFNKEIQPLQDMIDYAEANKDIMCEGESTDLTKIKPWLKWTIKAAIKKLKGEELPDPTTAPSLTELKDISITGFRAHLVVMQSFFRSSIYDGASDTEYLIYKTQADRQPRNALFQALYHKYKDGNQNQAIDIVMDNSIFPSDKLPTSNNRCETYLWQRDDEPGDWGPCPERQETYEGIDLEILYKILEG